MNFTIDNKTFNNVGIISLVPTFEIKERDDKGISTTTGTVIKNIIGTFVSYNIVLDFKKYNIEDRRELMKILIAPVEFHTFVLPLDVGDIGDYSFDGHITTPIPTELLRSISINEWGQIPITIEAKERLPDGMFD